ncbi:DUF4412 domain-containing protein [candidate division KSB1 bacterium]|nr:DUF4412 domain-containing protein [candidate division KSB1 bacterium]
MWCKGLCLMLYVWVAVQPVSGGWQIETVTSAGQEVLDTESIYLQQNQIKFVTPETVTIFKLDSNLIYFLKPASQTYWSGTAAAFKNEMEIAINREIENTIKDLPLEQQHLLQRMWVDLKNSSGHTPDSQQVRIKAVKATPPEQLAGFKCELYQIWVQQHRVEEVWLTDQIDIQAEIDFDKFLEMKAIIRGKSSTEDYEHAPEYRQLLKKGYRLRIIQYGEEEERVVTEVKFARQLVIPAAEFEIPASYHPVSISEILQPRLHENNPPR